MTLEYWLLVSREIERRQKEGKKVKVKLLVKRYKKLYENLQTVQKRHDK